MTTETTGSWRLATLLYFFLLVVLVILLLVLLISWWTYVPRSYYRLFTLPVDQRYGSLRLALHVLHDTEHIKGTQSTWTNILVQNAVNTIWGTDTNSTWQKAFAEGLHVVWAQHLVTELVKLTEFKKQILGIALLGKTLTGENYTFLEGDASFLYTTIDTNI